VADDGAESLCGLLVMLGEDSQVAKAGLARELNNQIRKIGSSLTEAGDADETLTFFCECGCMAEIQLSLPEYVARGALSEGHSLPAAN
jgi:hypothetical protein